MQWQHGAVGGWRDHALITPCCAAALPSQALPLRCQAQRHRRAAKLDAAAALPRNCVLKASLLFFPFCQSGDFFVQFELFHEIVPKNRNFLKQLFLADRALSMVSTYGTSRHYDTAACGGF